MKHNFDKDRASKVHNNKYDYSKVVYKNADTKVEIICPEHGPFWQKSYLHILHANGCPKCKGKKIQHSKQWKFEDYEKIARRIHKNKYSYIKQDLPESIFTKVEIICPIHGSFWQTFNNHIHNKNGCPHCGYNVSVLEKEWLDSLKISPDNRQICLWVGSRKFKVDAYVPETNTVYEFFGIFWHGHPDFVRGINPRTGKPFAYYYQKTLDKIRILKAAGYNIIEKWG